MKNLETTFFSLFHIGVSIHQLNKRSEKQSGLSIVQWCLLKKLIDMPATPAHSLAEAVGIHPSTLTQTLKRLERKKFIFVMEDPDDSRKKIISITRIGKNTLEATTEKMSALLKNISDFEAELSLVQICLQGTYES